MAEASVCYEHGKIPIAWKGGSKCPACAENKELKVKLNARREVIRNLCAKLEELQELMKNMVTLIPIKRVFENGTRVMKFRVMEPQETRKAP